MNEITNYSTQETGLEAKSNEELDTLVVTAKRFPRNLSAVLNDIATLAMLDKDTAGDCFYVLRREGANGQNSVIEGVSVRMAEIIASCWGNLSVDTEIIANDGKMITARATCRDLQSNYSVSKTVSRRITTKAGKTFSEDMQVVTGNAASAIAFRNAVLAVIPKAITKKIVEETKKVAMGQAIDLETGRQNCLANYLKIGVTDKMILSYLEINSVEEIDKEKLLQLKGTWNAIKEGTTTKEESFIKPYQEKLAAEASVKAAKSAADKVAEAMKAGKGAPAADKRAEQAQNQA